MRLAATAFALGVAARGAMGVEVLVLTCNNEDIDNAVIQSLEAQGHVVTIGPPYFELDTEHVIGGSQVVYLQTNWNWNIGDIPEGGQQKLLTFLELGGGIVTCEWLYWKLAIQGEFQTIEPVLPATTDGSYFAPEASGLAVVTPDPTLNEGLPDSFEFPVDLIDGSETQISAKEGATIFYDSTTSFDGVVGWEAGNGRVLSFSLVNGLQPVADQNYGRLLANAMTWAAGDVNEICPADCNNDLVLNILDFICYQQLFQSGDEGADINGDGALNILDFVAFQSGFVAGCI